MYRADSGTRASADVVGAGCDGDVASVDEPPEQPDNVPNATNALIPTGSGRVCFLTSAAWTRAQVGA